MDWNPDAIPDAKLGELQAEFRPMRGTVFAGAILTALTCAGMLFFGFSIYRLLFFEAPPAARGKRELGIPTWFVVAMCVGAMYGLGLMAVVLWRKTLEARNSRLEVFENGLRRYTNNGWQTAFWKDISVIRETLTYQRPPILHYPAALLLPKLKNAAYTLTLANGETWGFDGDTVSRINRLGKILNEVADGKEITWEVETVHIGD